jgi:hypothetical protein
VSLAHVLAGLASYVFVGLKAFQQLNVVRGLYRWVLPTSLAMAACEVYVVANIARMGVSLPLVLSLGVGAGLGAMTSMAAHGRWL